MRRVKLYGLLIGVLFFLIVLGVSFYAKTKLKPEELKSSIQSFVNQKYPEIDLSIGKLNIATGFNFRIEGKNIELKKRNEKGKRVLGSLKKLDVDIPFFNVLFGGGNIDINGFGFVIEDFNFERAKKTSSKNKKEKTREELKREKFNLPSFLSKSKINLSFNNISFKHKIMDGVIKLLEFKNISLENSVPFKLISKLKNKKEKLEVNFSSSGEFHLGNFLENGIIDGFIEADIKNLKYEKVNLKNLKINSVLLLRDKNIGNIDLKLEATNGIHGRFKIISNTEGELNVGIEELLIDSQLLDQFNLTHIFKEIGIKPRFKIQGGLVFSQKGIERPRLKVKITSPIRYLYKGIDSVIENLNLSLINKDVDLRLEIKTLKGKVLLNLKNKINLNKILDFQELSAFKGSLTFENMKIPRDLIKKRWSSSRSASKKNIKKEKKEFKIPLILPFKLALLLKNIKIDKEVLHGSAEIIGTQKKLALRDANFNFDKAKIKVSSTVHQKKKRIDYNINIKIEKMSFSSFEWLLPERVPYLSGPFDSNLIGKGSFKRGQLYYDIYFDAKVGAGRLINLNLDNLINPLASKVKMIKLKKRI